MIDMSVAAITYISGRNILPAANQIKDLGPLLQNTLSTSRQCVKVAADNMTKLFNTSAVVQ